MKAVWNSVVIAESNETIVVEHSHYFPPDSISEEYFKESDHQTVCSWKGIARYYSIVVNGETNENAAWYYPETLEAATNIKGYIAFWNGVDVGE